jgi:TPR repeat protein
MIRIPKPFPCALLQWVRASSIKAGIICLLVSPCLAAAAAGSTTNWLTLSELRKKWESVSRSEIQRLAEAGDTEAMIQLYSYHWEARGVSGNRTKAMEWLKKAADGENAQAQYLMGYQCETVEWVGEGKERHLTKPDWQGALRWYGRAAEQGWAMAKYNLGLLYLAGEAVEVDEARALELIRSAADQNLPAAIRELAELYACGIGEPRNEADRPVALLERGGGWGDLQLRYEYRIGTERDLVMAARCFCKKRINQTMYYSPYGLADFLEFKRPMSSYSASSLMIQEDSNVQIYGPSRRSDADASEDLLRMLSVYLKAAKGDGPSALQIGDRYLVGRDVPKSDSSAWVWYSIAAQRGTSEARAKIAQIEARMTESEFKEARRLLPIRSEELREIARYLE